VAEVLFFQLSSVIESNVPFVRRREGVVIGRATSDAAFKAPAQSTVLDFLLSVNRDVQRISQI